MLQKIKNQWNRWPFTNGLIVGLILFFSIYIPITNIWAPQLIEVRGQSMFPTLHNGNLAVFITKFNEIKREDIVCFIPPDRDQFYCKRIIGLPGDEIIIAGNDIIINGEFYHEYYVALYSHEKAKIIKVPPSHYFVMGDNRPYSMDSRYFGCIPRSDINSKMFIKIW